MSISSFVIGGTHCGHDRVLAELKYHTALRKQQEELIKLQNWVIKNDQKVVVLFEGRDAAGKGGAIRRITEPSYTSLALFHTNSRGTYVMCASKHSFLNNKISNG